MVSHLCTLLKKSILIFLLTLLPLVGVVSQEIDFWNVYSSFSTVNTVVASDAGETLHLLWEVFLHLRMMEFDKVYTTTEGMHRLNPSHSVYDDDQNRIILAYSDGTIDLIKYMNLVYSREMRI
ncbi:MAG: hypothetical protein BalsKO_01780 [Balneolaceae bacterium]